MILLNDSIKPVNDYLENIKKKFKKNLEKNRKIYVSNLKNGVTHRHQQIILKFACPWTHRV